MVQAARLCLAQGLGSLTRQKRKRFGFEDNYTTLKPGLQLKGYCNRKALEEGKYQLRLLQILQQRMLWRFACGQQRCRNVAPQLLEGVSANRGVEEACQAERRSPHTIRELGESSLEVAAPKGSSRWLALDPERYCPPVSGSKDQICWEDQEWLTQSRRSCKFLLQVTTLRQRQPHSYPSGVGCGNI